jgi:hypothetical protein
MHTYLGEVLAGGVEHLKGPPVWRRGLGHCIAVLAVPPETLGSRSGTVAAGRNQDVRGATHNWPSG